MNRDLLVNYFDYHSLVTALVVAEEFTPAPNLKMLLPSQVEKHRQSVETFHKDLERRTSALKEAIQRRIVNIYKADGALGEEYALSEMHALIDLRLLSLWVEGIPHKLMEDSTGNEWLMSLRKGRIHAENLDTMVSMPLLSEHFTDVRPIEVLISDFRKSILSARANISPKR